MQGESDEDERSPEFQVALTEEDQDSLIQEARTMHQFFEGFNQAFNMPENESFYVISVKWLNKWKKYTSYDEVTKNRDPNLKWFGQTKPGRINEDIVEQNARFIRYPDDEDYRNIFLKEEIQEKRDYELITKDAWEFISSKYSNIAVERFAFTYANGMKAVEVRLKRVSYNIL